MLGLVTWDFIRWVWLCEDREENKDCRGISMGAAGGNGEDGSNR